MSGNSARNSGTTWTADLDLSVSIGSGTSLLIILAVIGGACCLCCIPLLVCILCWSGVCSNDDRPCPWGLWDTEVCAIHSAYCKWQIKL